MGVRCKVKLNKLNYKVISNDYCNYYSFGIRFGYNYR